MPYPCNLFQDKSIFWITSLWEISLVSTWLLVVFDCRFNYRWNTYIIIFQINISWMIVFDVQTTLTFLFFAVNVEKHHTPRARVHVCLYPGFGGIIAANRCPAVRYFSVSYVRTRTYEATVSADLYTNKSQEPSVCLTCWATVSVLGFSGYFSVFCVYPFFFLWMFECFWVVCPCWILSSRTSWN